MTRAPITSQFGLRLEDGTVTLDLTLCEKESGQFSAEANSNSGAIEDRSTVSLNIDYVIENVSNTGDVAITMFAESRGNTEGHYLLLEQIEKPPLSGTIKLEGIIFGSPIESVEFSTMTVEVLVDVYVDGEHRFPNPCAKTTISIPFNVSVNPS